MKITADATISLHLVVYGKIWNASILHALFDYVHLDTNCTQETQHVNIHLNNHLTDVRRLHGVYKF